jgi:flagellin-specific chaperone FliS
MAKKCKYRKDNKSCKNYALTGDNYCFFHSPRMAKERAQAQRKGGKRALGEKKRVLAESNVQIQNTADIIKLLNVTINQVRTGGIEVKIANAIGYLSGICLKALEQGDIEKRLEVLEEKVFSEATG